MSTIAVSNEASTQIPEAGMTDMRLEVVRDQVEEYERSGGKRGTTLRGVPVVVITSVGARSGKLRKNPVMRVEHDGVYAAVGSKMGAPQNPAWVRNLLDLPLVELQDQTAKAEYIAHEASGDERAVWSKRALDVWPDYAEYQTKTDRHTPCSCSSLWRKRDAG